MLPSFFNYGESFYFFMSNLNIPFEQWLKKLFEYEYCAECHGDAVDHDAIPFNGNWFARCKDNAQCRVENCIDH